MMLTVLQRCICRFKTAIARTFAFIIVSAVTITVSAQSQSLSTPARKPNALSGQSLLDLLNQTTGSLRQEVMTREILDGNIPDVLRTLQPVCWNAAIANSSGTLISRRVCLFVTPDYLSIGSNTDSLRIPFMPHFGQRIADQWDCQLPTTKMVDMITVVSPVRVPPHPFNPRIFEISNLEVWRLSDDAIDSQLANYTKDNGSLLSGVKKDVVVTNRLSEKSRSPRVAIYGWYKMDNAPIQPLTLVHAATYVDYSHGIRLASRTMTIDGETSRVDRVLLDPELAWVLSDEGVMTSSTIRYPTNDITQP